jgi:hypothetical protein
MILGIKLAVSHKDEAIQVAGIMLNYEYNVTILRIKPFGFYITAMAAKMTEADVNEIMTWLNQNGLKCAVDYV